MLVEDYKLQISEAYRVMKPGSIACFSVWGRRENCLQFEVMGKVRERLGKEPMPAVARTTFHLSDNWEETK